ncbi:hypothetical protein MHEL_59950 [Mycolicibacterium helvum]|uniref:Uncharacterized protein n=1 Tax=Mycolicibacterium helvum TaxID=1534349 RepID=A0A7I7TEV1_9MYCO|nr:hypothetical protein MHEL_59950 [Mycolicibacterium helvum]
MWQATCHVTVTMPDMTRGSATWALCWFFAVIGVIAVSIGIVFIVAVPISASDSDGLTLSCGTTMKIDEQSFDRYAEMRLSNPDPSGPPPDCVGAIRTRRTWAITTAGVGAALLVSALALGRSSRRADAV